MSFCVSVGAAETCPSCSALLCSGIRSMFTQFLWELLQLNEPAENGMKTLTGFCQITNRTSRVRLQGEGVAI